ncbi:MAG: aminopeptidase [Gammaproteobacteria bacterium]
MSYYSQAIRGHISLYKHRIPLQEAFSDPRLNEQQRERLAQVPEIMAFAQQALELSTDHQYQTVVFLEHPIVTWNVFAAPTHSLEPKTWCYILLGCVSYRGYFTESAARAYAEQLTAQGWETYVGGASAYSTLGWFEDPILSPFLHRNTEDLAGLLFHELAHQQLYIAHDTTFNESFATAVELAGVTQWRQQQMDPPEDNRYTQRLRVRDEFLALAMHTRSALQHLYKQQSSAQDTQTERQKILADFRAGYEQRVTTHWAGQRPYNSWMKESLNNAQWNTLGAYYDLVPAFTALLHATGTDFSTFYALCKKLGKLPKAQRHEHLAQCTLEACPFAATADVLVTASSGS